MNAPGRSAAVARRLWVPDVGGSNPPAPTMITLREYQIEAVKQARACFRNGRRAILLVAPTGSGKTVVASHVVESSVSKGNRVLFIAHRRELISQTVDKLIRMGISKDSIGVMMGKHELTDPSRQVQVASVQTLARRQLPEAQLVVVDEAHHSTAKTYQRPIKHYLEVGSVILGMTATPYRADNKFLGDVYDDLVSVATPWELIDLGFLVEPQVWTASPEVIKALKSAKTIGGDYSLGDLDQIMNVKSIVGNIVQTWKTRAGGVRTVVFAVSVQHSKSIVESFVNAGVRAEHLDGTTPNDIRDSILARVESGETTVVSNVGVLTEGWDQPSVKCCILARPTKSLGLYIQMSGRILRPYNDQSAIILDHAGCYDSHGLPHADRVLSLEGKVSDVNEKERGKEKICRKCGLVIPTSSSVCPGCGFEFGGSISVDEVSGELQRVDGSRPTEADMLQAWGCILRGWVDRNDQRMRTGQKCLKYGWCSVQFSKQFGQWPSNSMTSTRHSIESSHACKAYCYDGLMMDAVEKKRKLGWAYHRFVEIFGHRPDSVEMDK